MEGKYIIRKDKINITKVPTFTCSLKNPPVLYTAIFSTLGNILVKEKIRVDKPTIPIINRTSIVVKRL